MPRIQALADDEEINRRIAITIAFTAALKSEPVPQNFLSSDGHTNTSTASKPTLATRICGSQLLIRDCPQEQLHCDALTPKHKVLARRLKCRLSRWRLLPKQSKQSKTAASFVILTNPVNNDSSTTKRDLGRASMAARSRNAAKFRRHSSTSSLSSGKPQRNSTLPVLSQNWAQETGKLSETDPFMEENVLDTSLEAVLMLLPDGSSTPRRHSAQRQSALPHGLDLSKKTKPQNLFVTSDKNPSQPPRFQLYPTEHIAATTMLTPAIPLRTTSRARGVTDPPSFDEPHQDRKHIAPSIKSWQSVEACCKDMQSMPRTPFSFRKSATVQELGAGVYGLYEATTISQKRRSTPSRKAKLIHLKGKSVKTIDSLVIVPKAADSDVGKSLHNSVSDTTLAATPSPTKTTTQNPTISPSPKGSTVKKSGRPLKPRSANLQELSRSPPLRNYLPSPEKLMGPPSMTGSFNLPAKKFRDQENLSHNIPDKKKHPSPTKAEWDLLGNQWRKEMDSLGLRGAGLAPASTQLDSNDNPHYHIR